MYALQTVISELGYNAIVIDYKNEAVTEREMPMRLSLKRSLKYNLKCLLFGRKHNSKIRKIKKFVGKNIDLGESCRSDNYKTVFNQFDCIITGSDQIWNSCLTNNDYVYFLDGYKGKKISYAASSGINGIIDERAADLLKHYTYVGVRENTLKSELKSHHIEAFLNCDPTLLLDKKRWSSLITNQKRNKRYILLYMMTQSQKIIEFANKLAFMKGCELINANPISLQKFKMKSICDATPGEWLALIQNAEYVVTNSFHGLAFSINFNKQFFTEITENEANNSSRLKSLLELLELENRNIASNKFSVEPIDFNIVNTKLDEMRKESMNYLKRALI